MNADPTMDHAILGVLCLSLAFFAVLLGSMLHESGKFNGWRRVAIVSWVLLWATPPLVRLYLAVIL